MGGGFSKAVLRVRDEEIEKRVRQVETKWQASHDVGRGIAWRFLGKLGELELFKPLYVNVFKICLKAV